MAAQNPGQFVADDGDHLLGRGEGGEHLGAHSLLLDGFHQLLDDFEIDVGFEKRYADFAQSRLHVRRGELAFTAQVLENAL